ncbi:MULTISPECIES: hypothetical protein [Staphylococcus]|uniref:Phage protein n=1 Tax=Staphylococcus agnetis TaxID=985762 RepID=A0AAW9YVH7_9STAP|nr:MULTISPECIES: hypothetical protein [Staphylococcus]NHM92461.1 hypothetical protein [Staphylococcus sp. 10602379]NJI02499.1 hypothetical protein [Staphylococcus agnetis]
METLIILIFCIMHIIVARIVMSRQDKRIKQLEDDKYKQKIISNQYSTEIEQALNNKDLNESLFLLEKIKMDLEEVLKNG